MFYPYVKAEAEADPDLGHSRHFHFKFPPSHDHPSHSPDIPPTPLFRFGSYSSDHNHHNHPYMSYSDDYDDVVPYIPGQLSSASTERAVRRRSSKACDQCRKSKCKCERSGPNEPCKSCIMLGTPCTFLGPSRKRGPPKGYIDAIEARLHQTEALVGIMLSSKDSRAQSLLRDIAQDPLAKEIITRVDNSPYGVKGRKRSSESPTSSNKKAESPPAGTSKENEGEKLDLTSTHPSNEWQDKVIDMLGAGRANEPAYVRVTPISNGKPSLRVATYSSDDNVRSKDGRERQRRRLGNEDYPFDDINPGFSSPTSTSASGPNSAGSGSRDDTHGEDDEEQFTQAVGELSLNEDEEVRYHGQASGLYLLGVQERIDKRNEGGIWRFPGARVWPPLPTVAESSSDAEANSVSVTVANSPPRSGLTNNFSVLHKSDHDFNGTKYLPPRNEQERLLQLYFTFVHPSFPVVHKKAFWEVWRNGGNGSPHIKRNRRIAPLLLLTMFALAARYDIPAPSSSPLSFPSPSTSESPPPSTSTTPLPTDGVTMWTAGEEYFNAAKSLLDTSYVSSRPSTCQALLLMGYREIGIGAMALAWTYIGMAIRMAQDLGMHRKADGWRRPSLGKSNEASTMGDEEGRIFGDWELGERRRIWFGCVIMDKYVSAYIGRPLMIFERDFDTEFPDLTEASSDLSEELEDWKVLGTGGQWTNPVPGRVISCFNKCAELSGILSSIIQAIYAVRPFPSGPGTSNLHTSRPAGRQAETAKQAAVLEGVLNRWYFDLPEHLRYDIAATPERDSSASLPPAHVLTLHMQYWCAVLLLHRPFIRRALNSRSQSVSGDPSDSDDLGLMNSKKSYELCASAANHITSIVTAYRDRYPLNICSVFLCYYLFTASIMHVISLSAYPDDPQAHINLRRCLDALTAMRYVWPSAARALELLKGAKMNLANGPGASAFAVTTSNLRRGDAISATSGTDYR
ncbi:Nitrogen assimilation transcription factor nirA [Leucoagaricus sp. SymC.cos]|nr:Nitrogen assimilation transcription factor nirA [Leucoagaricus sp. SymC.cos]